MGSAQQVRNPLRLKVVRARSCACVCVSKYLKEGASGPRYHQENVFGHLIKSQHLCAWAFRMQDSTYPENPVS